MARRSIRKAHIRAGISRARAALGRLERYREAAKETMSQVVTTLEVSASSFGMGWLKGRYGETDVMGVPVDLGAAAVLHVVAFTGLMGRDMSRHGHALANGSLASYLTDQGRKIGTDMANDSASGVAGGRRRRAPAQMAGAPAQNMSASQWAAQRQAAQAGIPR